MEQLNKRSLKIGIALLLVIALFTMPMLAETSATEIGNTISSMVNIIKAYFYKDVDSDSLLVGALKGMFSTLDKHSEYFTKDEFKEFFSSVSGEFGGIGIVVEKKTHITVVSPLEGTPGERLGFRTGDEIIFVDDTDISEFSLEAAVKLMRGEPGTNVRLGVKRKGVAEIMYIDVVRELIKINPIKYEVKEDNIGYIKISQFNGNVYSKMKDALKEMETKKVQGIVIDLRNNPGGLLDEVVEICKLLVPKGPIVHIDYKNNRETYRSTLEKAPYKLVVLVNGGSASASEIMAGAVKDSGAGIVVGEKTYGKGSVQSILNLIGGAGVKITTAHYLTPSEFALDGIGITPDIEVKPANTAEVLAEYSPIKADRTIRTHLQVGLDVQGVQQRLIALGYSIKNADGVYRTETKNAVKKFEEDQKLEIDGIFKPLEQEELLRIFEETLSKQDPQLEKAIQEIKNLIK